MDLIGHLRARIEELETTVLRSLAAAGAAAGALIGITRIQTGEATLVNGTVTVPAIITANSRIVVQFATSFGGDGGAVPFTTRLETPLGNRVVGSPGSFDIVALTNAGLPDASNGSSVDWIVIN